MKSQELSKKYKQYVIDLRRDFHMNPEPSMEEYETSKRIKEELSKIGVEYVARGGTGVVATIKGEKNGKTVALRGDMDALSLEDKKTVLYKSKVEGMCHGCGHDGHTAMLLGAAKVLNEMKDEINGTVKLFFQPGEEVAKGAKAMIEDGALDGVDSVMGLHLMVDQPVGKICAQPGPFTASTDRFIIKIKGKGGHGARPDQAIDAAVITSSIVMNLQTIVSRETSPLDSVVLTVGKLQSGSRFNIIAEDGYIEGTVRYFTYEKGEEVPKQMERIVKGITEAMRATYEFEYQYLTFPVINDEACSLIGEETARKLVGEEGVLRTEKSTGGEDMSFFMKEKPGVMAYIGAGNKEKGIVNPHHHPMFDVDEDALEIGTSFYVQYALDYLNS